MVRTSTKDGDHSLKYWRMALSIIDFHAGEKENKGHEGIDESIPSPRSNIIPLPPRPRKIIL